MLSNHCWWTVHNKESRIKLEGNHSVWVVIIHLLGCFIFLVYVLMLILFLLPEIQHLFYCKENDWGFSHFLSWNVSDLLNLTPTPHLIHTHMHARTYFSFCAVFFLEINMKKTSIVFCHSLINLCNLSCSSWCIQMWYLFLQLRTNCVCVCAVVKNDAVNVG